MNNFEGDCIFLCVQVVLECNFLYFSTLYTTSYVLMSDVPIEELCVQLQRLPEKLSAGWKMVFLQIREFWGHSMF